MIAEDQFPIVSSLPGRDDEARVWLLRHAESADPTVFHGAESDIGLSERGRRQAAAMAPLMASWRPARIVASAMLRARETATPGALACGLPLALEPALHERRVGALSGTPFQRTEGVWPDTLRRWLAGDTGYAPPHAESFDAIAARVLPVWRRLTAEPRQGGLVIVAHGVVIKVLLLSLLPGLGPAAWHRLGAIHNLGVHELAGTGADWRLLRFNEVPAQVRACV